MIRRPPRSTPLYSSAASDVYKRQEEAICTKPWWAPLVTTESAPAKSPFTTLRVRYCAADLADSSLSSLARTDCAGSVVVGEGATVEVAVVVLFALPVVLVEEASVPPVVSPEELVVETEGIVEVVPEEGTVQVSSSPVVRVVVLGPGAVVPSLTTVVSLPPLSPLSASSPPLLSAEGTPDTASTPATATAKAPAAQLRRRRLIRVFLCLRARRVVGICAPPLRTSSRTVAQVRSLAAAGTARVPRDSSS